VRTEEETGGRRSNSTSTRSEQWKRIQYEKQHTDKRK